MYKERFIASSLAVTAGLGLVFGVGPAVAHAEEILNVSDEVQADAAEKAIEEDSTSPVSAGEVDASVTVGSDDSDAVGDNDAAAEDDESALGLAGFMSESDPVAMPISQPRGWVLEGDSWFYYDADGSKHTGWLVTGEAPGNSGAGLQRYWLDSEGRLAVGRLISSDEAGWWAYATDSGYVVRGSYDAGNGLVYLADNDGVLAGGESGGWVVSSAYGQGLQRYWIDGSVHAAEAGYSDEGWSHYTTGQGYVLRGAASIDGQMVYADNDGALKTGWLVTSDFGQGLQRYWLSEGKVATSRLVSASEAGYNAYAQADGRILRGKLRYGNGMLVADNDGRLAWTTGDGGWVITADYDGSMQRYWIDDSPGDGLKGARIGLFTVAGQNYYGRDDQGYVVRGEWTAPNGTVYYGDNDGVVTEGQPIMGASRYTAAQMVAYYKATGKAYPSAALGRGGASSIETFCAILCEEAAAEGVRAEVVFAQAMLETAWLQFGGDVHVEQFNFAGIGATGGGVPGNSFADVRTGLRAQVQHLKAYASTAALNNPCVDPRFSYVTRGCAPTIEKLSNKWAASSTYGEDMKRVLNGLSNY